MSAPFAGHGPARREYAFSQADFAAIATFARDNFGLNLPASKKPLVYSRLARRIRALGLPDFRSYRALLQGPKGESESAALLSALTTNVTRFFREAHHFAILRETVLPPLIAAARAGGRVRLWSAGCSSGQEAYSIAMTILQLCPEAPRLDCKVLATDIDPTMIEKARRGLYPLEESPAIPEPLRKRYVEECAGQIRLGPDPRALVRFGVLNLARELPVSGPFDTIFCRNVAIYFDKPTQEALWQRLAAVLAPERYLFIGHSERIFGPAAEDLKSVGITAYAKKGGQARLQAAAGSDNRQGATR